MNNEVRKWLRPPEKIVEEEDRYASLDRFFLGEDEAGLLNVYEIEKDDSWTRDVFAVALVNGVKEGKHFIRQDFSEITLAGAFLQGAVLHDSDFSGGNLVAVDFYGSDLERVNFTVCDLRKADFRRCNLKGADFKEANLAGAIFDDADLTGADFTGSYVIGAKLGSAKIDEKTRSEFEKMAQIVEDAEKGLIPLHHLPNSLLRMLDWRRMYLGGVDLSQVALTGISMVGVNLSGTMQLVMAVPPTRVDYKEKKPEEEHIAAKVTHRPEPKPDVEMQTRHEEYEYMDIFADEKLKEDDKSRPDKKPDKAEGSADSGEADDRSDQEAVAMRLDEMKKRFDKTNTRMPGNTKGKIRT